MGSAFEPLCVVQKRAAALRKKIDMFDVGTDHYQRKVGTIIIETGSRRGPAVDQRASNYFDCFDPTAALSTKFFTLGLETLVLGLAFFGFPLDSFIVLGLSCARRP